MARSAAHTLGLRITANFSWFLLDILGLASVKLSLCRLYIKPVIRGWCRGGLEYLKLASEWTIVSRE